MNTIWIIVIILVCIAVIVAVIVAFVYRRKFAGIKHYEEIRDEITVNKPKKQKDDEEISISFGSLISNLIFIFIVIVVGINMMPTILDQVNNVCSDSMNVTSTGCTYATKAILDFVPIFFTLITLTAGLYWAIMVLRGVGLV